MIINLLSDTDFLIANLNQFTKLVYIKCYILIKRAAKLFISRINLIPREAVKSILKVFSLNPQITIS